VWIGTANVATGGPCRRCPWTLLATLREIDPSYLVGRKPGRH
jgi:hypothetical protein